jgi:hypothetical protein
MPVSKNGVVWIYEMLKLEKIIKNRLIYLK